jgi:hypothetical protein
MAGASAPGVRVPAPGPGSALTLIVIEASVLAN